MTTQKLIERLLDKLDNNPDTVTEYTDVTLIAKYLNGINDTRVKVTDRIAALEQLLTDKSDSSQTYETYMFAIKQLKDVLKWLPK